MRKTWVVFMLALTLSAGLTFGTGCATRRNDAFEPVRRTELADPPPMRSLEEEKSTSDKVGEAGVATVIVTFILGILALPLLLF